MHGLPILRSPESPCPGAQTLTLTSTARPRPPPNCHPRSNRMSWPLWLVVSLVAVLGVLRPLGRWLQRKGRDMERHD